MSNYYKSMHELVGHTPLVSLGRLRPLPDGVRLFAKLHRDAVYLLLPPPVIPVWELLLQLSKRAIALSLLFLPSSLRKSRL